MFHSKQFKSFFLGSALILAGTSACTLLAPGESQDGVQRCGSSIDCGEDGLDPDDNRVGFNCVHAEGQNEDSPGVCEPTFQSIDCGFPASDSSEIAGILAKAIAKKDVYLQDCTPGSLGCLPNDEQNCDSGLSKTTLTGAKGDIVVCSDGDDTKPASIAYKVLSDALGAGADDALLGIDVRAQFCAWYFCDANFSCNASKADKGQWRCTYCDPQKTPDQGGCARITVGGEVSPVYLGADHCNNGSSKASNAEAGDPPA